jgi:hypothetical protein
VLPWAQKLLAVLRERRLLRRKGTCGPFSLVLTLNKMIPENTEIK